MSNISLFKLAEGIRKCTACPLHKSRTLAVPGEGKENSKIMLVSEAPGTEEDRLGRPFVGRAGRFLDQLLKDAGLERNKTFLTNSVKCHPLNNRLPTAEELKTCKRLWLDKQIDIIKPQLILLLGRVALKSLLKENNLASWHGRTIKREGQNYFISYHPAAGLRFPQIRKEMEKDFKKLTFSPALKCVRPLNHKAG